MDLAKASCCILFISANSADDPACSDISFATVAKSLFNDACLAFSKLISFPNNNSASNSFEIELSKSSKLPAMASTLSNSIPKDLAVATASAINAGFLLNDNVVAADTLPISFNKSFSFNKTPFCIADILAWAINSPVMSFMDWPVANEIEAIPASSSLVNPAISLISVIWTSISWLRTTPVPNCLFIATKESCIPCVLTKLFNEESALFLSSILVAKAES